MDEVDSTARRLRAERALFFVRHNVGTWPTFDIWTDEEILLAMCTVQASPPLPYSNWTRECLEALDESGAPEEEARAERTARRQRFFERNASHEFSLREDGYQCRRCAIEAKCSIVLRDYMAVLEPCTCKCGIQRADCTYHRS